jgi:hypothetical protein
MHIQIHAKKPLVPQPSAFDVDIDTEKFEVKKITK